MSLSTDLFKELVNLYGNNLYRISQKTDIDIRQLKRLRDNVTKHKYTTLEKYAKSASISITYNFQKHA